MKGGGWGGICCRFVFVESQSCVTYVGPFALLGSGMLEAATASALDCTGCFSVAIRTSKPELLP